MEVKSSFGLVEVRGGQGEVEVSWVNVKSNIVELKFVKAEIEKPRKYMIFFLKSTYRISHLLTESEKRGYISVESQSSQVEDTS